MSEPSNDSAPVLKAVDERRAHQRYEAELEVQGTPEQGGVVARMITSNLSMGGLHCVSSADFPEMTRLAVRLMLPMPATNGTEPVDLEAVVVRREELASTSGDSRFELALFFTGLDNGDKARLARYLEV